MRHRVIITTNAEQSTHMLWSLQSPQLCYYCCSCYFEFDRASLAVSAHFSPSHRHGVILIVTCNSQQESKWAYFPKCQAVWMNIMNESCLQLSVAKKKRLQKNNGISSETVNYVCFSYYSTWEAQQLFFFLSCWHELTLIRLHKRFMY